ncbi:Pollen-specific protein-like [Zea mays]|uniref:Pollen-specific protein-like n=1 Tax=Zea mays TaxID=4577 RepID=A0A1D6FQX6_MAIZE|nr:Pollen-specific protein-like [Zea mays]
MMPQLRSLVALVLVATAIAAAPGVGPRRLVQDGDQRRPPGRDLRRAPAQEPRGGLRRDRPLPRPLPRPAHPQRRHQAERRPLRQPHRLPPQGAAPQLRRAAPRLRPLQRDVREFLSVQTKVLSLAFFLKKNPIYI